jgi:hypothetical protein
LPAPSWDQDYGDLVFKIRYAAPTCICIDDDGDGYGNPGDASCPNGSQQDCDDNDDTIYPGATEACNDGKDNDCDGDTDCSDVDCTGDSACLPSAVAIPKTIEVTIPGLGCFYIRIDNPGPYDIYLSQSIQWTQTVPSDVQTTLLSGSVTVPAGQSTSVSLPCFDVGSGAEPDDYPLDIVWTGTDEMSNPIQVNTDPTLSLVSGGGPPGPPGGGPTVGGTASMANKIELMAPWIALTTLALLSIGITAARRFQKKSGN